jgi:exocyst complex protein 7
MKRVEKALVDLNTTNLRSNQNAISDFNALLNTGSAKLQEMLRVELNQHSTTIEPLHYLTKGTHVAQPTRPKLIQISFRSIFPVHP